MARDILAVSATGVPVERFFSGGPDLLVPKRRLMKDETTRMCMCLKYWLKCKDTATFKNSVSSSIADLMLGN
jgi:hypothetical protein